jgi:hypothetical protein
MHAPYQMAKSNKSNVRRVAIDTAHSKPTKPSPSLLQQSKNLEQMLSAPTRRLVRKITNSNQHRVTFAGQAMVAEYNSKNSTVMVTYDSGADGHYISEKDRKKVGLPILRISAKKVSVVNGSTCSMPLRSLSHNSPQRQRQQRPTHSMISQLHS